MHRTTRSTRSGRRPGRRRGRLAGRLVAAGVLVAVASGCSSGGGGGGASTADTSAGDASSQSGATRGSGSASDAGSGSGAITARASADAAVVERAIERRGRLSLVSDDVAASRSRVLAVASGAGGYVGDEQSASDARGRLSSTTLTVVVPTESFEAVLDAAARAGRVLDRAQTAVDRTSEVVDVTSRVKSSQASIERVRTLLSEADDVGDVIDLESVLSERQASLESLQAQQKSLASRTGTATLEVSIERTAQGREPTERTGFLGGLAVGWGALTSLGTVVATGAGAALPVLVVLGVPVVLLGWVLRRRLGRRPAAPEPGRPSDPPSPA